MVVYPVVLWNVIQRKREMSIAFPQLIKIARLNTRVKVHFQVAGERMQTTITFNTSGRYIVVPIFVTTAFAKRWRFTAILDTGAPKTEFSDESLRLAGLDIAHKESVQIEAGMQTQKYANVILPKTEICSQTIADLNVYVSRFEKSWGIDALIGLDFFRKFEVKINYKLGTITTEAL